MHIVFFPRCDRLFMIIKTPSIPDNDTSPGVLPYAVPEADAPIRPEDGKPVNVSPTEGNRPPKWQDFRPNVARANDVIYALLPQSVSYFVGMVGCSRSMYGGSLIPPEGLQYRGIMTTVHEDGTNTTFYGRPYSWFHEQVSIPKGWTMTTPPDGFTLPIFPGNFYNQNQTYMTYYSPVDWNLLTRYEQGKPTIAIWSSWELWRPENILPRVFWGYEDVYIESYFTVQYGLYAYIRPKRGSMIPPVFTLLSALFLLMSAGNVPNHSGSGRRIRVCRKLR